MGGAGMPEPVKRPGIGVLAQEGQEFEGQRNNQLCDLFPSIIRYEKSNDKYNDIDLETNLLSVTAAPVIILQGKFSISAHQSTTLRSIGIQPTDINDVPDIADFIPDVLVIRSPRDSDIIIQPDGSREIITNATSESRWAISIFDVKHTKEANPSYCAEIAMYALMMASWISHHQVLRDRFYVTTDAYLWTRFKQGDSELDRLSAAGGATTEQKIEALVIDSEDANLRFYLASVRRFFEDVVRVIRIGDASLDAWTSLEWHVNSACSSCDWLGDKRHLGRHEGTKVDSNQAAYCLPAAKLEGHLCLVPGITRGAKKVLQSNSLLTASHLAGAAGHSALQEHTVLKRDAQNLPIRSAVVLSGSIAREQNASIASLVGSANLLLYASVNFDSSAGLLTGLALSGVATTFTRGESPRWFRAIPYVVDEKSLAAEWIALEAFLSQIADYIQSAEDMPNSPRQPTGQIHFWENRQFQELCNAIGRHLSRVLELTQRKAKALAWVFAPEDLLAKPESLEASTIVVVEDIVRRMVFTPTPHVITLFDTSEHYRPTGSYAVAERDSYYREYLSNGIPRERIYEIWSNNSTVKRGSVTVPRNTVISQFSNTLEKQVKALELVCKQLREDYRRQFKARATRISTSIPTGKRSVAFDAKLWIWWDQLNFNMSQLESHIRLSLDGERLEATYEAIILRNGTQLSPELYEYDVSPGSTEAKFKEDSRLTLGKLGRPGMPLEKVTHLLTPTAPPFEGDGAILQSPLWSVLDAQIIEFDRINARLRVRFSNYREPQFAPYLMEYADVDLLSDVFLLTPKSPRGFDWSMNSTAILQEIGAPAIATPDQNALTAMGLDLPRSRRRTHDTETPAARVLWNADTLERSCVRTLATAQAISDYAMAQDDLNQSQALAVRHSSERALTVIWGPPGTGKTKTLASLVHGLSQESTSQGDPLKILVTGPTYKAVEEVMHRINTLLVNDSSSHGEMYMAYSVGRAYPPEPVFPPAHVSYSCISTDPQDDSYQQCCTSLSDDTSVVILGCSIRQARRFPESILGSLVSPLFDVVIIDESSQVPVSQALSALCGLKEDARLIVAGDHLQMPPIAAIESPNEAAYLVGSIQTYLLERQFSQPIEQCILETNYRSNEHIVAFARSIGYPASLQPYFPETAIHLLAPLPTQSDYPQTLPWCSAFAELIAPENKVVTLLHEDEVSSQGNRFEAKAVAGIVWMLRQSVSVVLDGRSSADPHTSPQPEQFWSDCVGIVTPHRAQRALVIRELETLFPAEQALISNAVDTVERFQGGQRHTIIVTFGVADTDIISGEEAFLMQLERTNVAVSRAMAKCIVVMPKSLAAYIPEDKKTLATAFALKDYIEEFCNIRVDSMLSDSTESRWAQIRYHQPS